MIAAVQSSVLFWAILAPVTLLGCVSPFAIRLAMRQASQAGSTAGSIYALSTAGSILGAR